MSRARAIATRAYHRASSDFGGANVDRLLLYGGLIAGGYIVYQIVKLLNKGKDTVDKGLQAAANAYVSATAGPPVQLADGIMFILPSGNMIAANLTTPVGGGKFAYAGKTYLPYEASPPGSGHYKVKVV